MLKPKQNFEDKSSSSQKKRQKNNIVEFPEKFSQLKSSTVTIKSKQNKSYTQNNRNYNKNNNKINNSNIVNFKSKSFFNNLFDKGGNNLPPIPLTFTILAFIILAFVFWSFTNKNSQQVFVGDKLIGIIKDKSISVEELKNTVIAKLKQELGTDILVNEEISLNPIHSTKKDVVSTDYVISKMADNFTFQVEAAAIFVDGKEIATLKNKAEAKEVLQKVSSKFVKDNKAQIQEPTFTQKVEIKEKFISEDDIMPFDTAFTLLNSNSDQGQKYTIKAGDTLYQVAIDHKMSMEQLLKINPDLTENTMLKIGQQINLVVPVPLLSVQTYEKLTFTEPIPKKIETVENNKEYKTFRKVISPGKDGSKEVVAKVIKVNGVETSREVISEKVLTEPTVEKVEVGTLKTPPKKAIGNFAYPIRGAQISSGFERRGRSMHAAIDFRSPYGTPIKASDGGTVIFSGYSGGYGNMVKIDHGNGFYTVYGHNSKNNVSVGQKVAQGEVIGYVGSTGNSTGNHVHFEIIKNGSKLNPLNYLK